MEEIDQGGRSSWPTSMLRSRMGAFGRRDHRCYYVNLSAYVISLITWLVDHFFNAFHWESTWLSVLSVITITTVLNWVSLIRTIMTHILLHTHIPCWCNNKQLVYLVIPTHKSSASRRFRLKAKTSQWCQKTYFNRFYSGDASPQSGKCFPLIMLLRQPPKLDEQPK